MKADDCTLNEFDQKTIRKQAELLLLRAEAFGRFPTPIADIVAAANLEVEAELAFDEQGIGELYRSLPNDQKLNIHILKKALGKVEGVLHRADNKIYIDPELHKSRQKFLTLHEVAHHFLPWQRSSFQILEDSEGELDESVRDQFEREANCFASDVWFQLDKFTTDARDTEFGIGPPIKLLTKRYGTSCYSTLRRYVNEYGRAAALLVFDVAQEVKTEFRVRRSLESKEFRQEFGPFCLPDTQRMESFFCQFRPLNRFRPPTPWMMERKGHGSIPCFVEAYDSTKQVFFLIYPARQRSVVLAA